MPFTELCECMNIKLYKQINPIGSMDSIVTTNCNFCTEEHLMILKNYVIKCHTYEQKIGNIWGLLSQNNFLLIFSKHWLSHYWVKGIYSTMYLNHLYLKISRLVFSTKYIFLGFEKYLKSNQVQWTKLNCTLC